MVQEESEFAVRGVEVAEGLTEESPTRIEAVEEQAVKAANNTTPDNNRHIGLFEL